MFWLFHQYRAVLIIAALLFPLSGTAATVAAQAGVFTITCDTFCGGPGAISAFDGDGGVGVSSALASVSGGPAGSGRGRADIVGAAIALPSLGAEAISSTGGQVVADAGAMQKYLYLGPDNSQFDLQLSLDGSVSAVQSDLAILAGNAAVVLASSLDFSVDPATFIGEIVALDPTATLLTDDFIDFAQAPSLFNMGQQTRSTTLSFNLDNGDEVFLYASLRVRGTRGAVADAFASLDLEFTGGNVADLTLVPVPAPFLLMASALGALACWRRR